jgi:hypothetical protein
MRWRDYDSLRHNRVALDHKNRLRPELGWGARLDDGALDPLRYFESRPNPFRCLG